MLVPDMSNPLPYAPTHWGDWNFWIPLPRGAKWTGLLHGDCATYNIAGGGIAGTRSSECANAIHKSYSREMCRLTIYDFGILGVASLYSITMWKHTLLHIHLLSSRLPPPAPHLPSNISAAVVTTYYSCSCCSSPLYCCYYYSVGTV